MTNNIKYPEEIKQDHDNRLFKTLFIKNFPSSVHDALRIEAILKKTSLSNVVTSALKNHIKKDAI